jgi:hypothetical protein
MVIGMSSKCLDGSALTPTSDEVWGDDKLLHLLGLPVTYTGEDPISPVYGTVGSECFSGLYPTPIRCAILKTPLVWCMNRQLDFLVGSAPHKMLSDDEITGWLNVNDPKQMEYHREILFPAFTAEFTSTSVFDLLPMTLPLPFNDRISVG